MRRALLGLAAAAALMTFGTMAFAQTTEPATKTGSAKAAKMEKKSPAMSATGKVAKFDRSTETLTLTTKEGEKEFTLGSNAKITEGATTATTADLAGKQAKVTYSHVDGKDVASKVTIAGSHPAKASTKPVAKK